jgi:dTMP kinase
VGLFITFEGLDGSGKSTQARLLFDDLERRGVPAVLTREPGGTRIGEQIRDTLHSTANVEMLPCAEVLLYSASRAQLVGELILPRLKARQVVVCDRYADSTLAYQGYGHGLDLDFLRTLTEFATSGLRPDLTVYLDLPVDVGLNRRRGAAEAESGEWNRMDQQTVDFYARVRQGYLEMIAAQPQRWLVVNAVPPANVVYDAVRQSVWPIVEQWVSGRA